MTPTCLAASSYVGVLILGVSCAVLIGAAVFVDRRFCPFRRMAHFRVQQADGVRFEHLWSAMIGDSPTHRTSFRGTLAFAIDSEWVYFRHTRVPFFPAIYRIPRKNVRLQEHKEWDIRITATDPPLNASLGPEFVRALRHPKGVTSRPSRS